MESPYRRTYLISVSFIALFIIAHQFAILYWIDVKTDHATILNDSGRQRMLSQKLAALIYHFDLTQDSLVKEEIYKIHDEIEMVHNGLILGNKKEGILQVSNPFRTQLRALTPKVKFSEYLIDNLHSLNQFQIKALQNNQDFYLTEMDKIVSGLEQSFNKKSRIVTISGIVLLILVFIILYIEHHYVYKKIMNRLLLQNKDLSNKNEMLEHYAYIASHDLKEPLRTVDNFIDAFKEDYAEKMEPGQHKYFNFIQDAIGRMKQMIEGLLIYSKVGKSGDLTAIDLNKLLAELKIDFASLIKEKQATILADELPTIQGLRTEIKQLFQNLISNALKFHRQGVAPEVKINYSSGKTHYQFCISDNGIGIDPQQKDAIFQLFTKLHNSSVYPGQGLGLAFCKKVVELHEGSIWIESEEGKGSAFYFTIKK